MKKKLLLTFFLCFVICNKNLHSAPLARPTKEDLQKTNPLLMKEKNINNTLPLTQALENLEASVQLIDNPLDAKAKQTVADTTPESTEERIEFHFENAELQSFISQIEAIFNITFMSDDAIDPLIKGGRGIKGHKINFRTQKPFTQKEAWNLFITFMQMIGFAVIKHTVEGIYRITTMQNALKMNIPSFIGTHYEDLPDTDELIRYVYFVENSALETIKVMIDSWRSSASSLIILQEQKAFVLTDRAHNVKILMEIIKELDRSTNPQIVSLLKLKQADARHVKELYDKIVKADDQNPTAKLLQKKQPSSVYFPENLRIIAEPRTNALILLGPQDSVKRVEAWISKHIDTSPTQAYSAYYTYQLKYADAVTISEIFNNAAQFGKDTEAGKFGGVRGSDKYLKPMVFIPEKETNKLIIKGDFEGYLAALERIEELDAPPKQVALDILILSVSIDETKALGSQIRSKQNAPHGLLGNNVAFQTSGLFGKGIVENQQEGVNLGVERLLGNLLELVKGAAAGNTILNLGSDALGAWGIFRALQTIGNTQIIADPFLTVSNKTPGTFSTGEERRVKTSTVYTSSGQPQEGVGQDSAKLELTIIPQINSDGMILLDFDLVFDSYLESAVTSANKAIRKIKTTAIAANKEIIALGGLVRTKTIESVSKVPVLGDIPVLGWFLGKNKQKQVIKDNLLILICPRLIDSINPTDMQSITSDKINQYEMNLSQMYAAATGKDPLGKLFFNDQNNMALEAEKLMFTSQAHFTTQKRTRASRKKISALAAQTPLQKSSFNPSISNAGLKKDLLFNKEST